MKPTKLTSTGRVSTFYPERLIYTDEFGMEHDLFRPEDQRSTITAGKIQIEQVPFRDLMGNLYWMQRYTQPDFEVS